MCFPFCTRFLSTYACGLPRWLLRCPNGRRRSDIQGFTMRALLVLATACQVAGFATMPGHHAGSAHPGGMDGSTNGCYGAGHSITCEKDGATEATCPAGPQGEGWQTKWTACGEPESPTPSVAPMPTPGTPSVAPCVAGLPDPRARPQPSPHSCCRPRPVPPDPPCPPPSAPTLFLSPPPRPIRFQVLVATRCFQVHTAATARVTSMETAHTLISPRRRVSVACSQVAFGRPPDATPARALSDSGRGCLSGAAEERRHASNSGIAGLSCMKTRVSRVVLASGGRVHSPTHPSTG